MVTVLFADLSGSTPLGESLDPEEMRAILGGYFGALAREIQRAGGVVDKYIGDAVMAVWGAPVSREDDALLAVGAALEMRTAMARENESLAARYGVRLSLRIGVNTGEVVAGLLAGDVQHAYTVVGDAVNTAQRLESAAAPDTVLVGESTYLLARKAFHFDAAQLVTLKGKAEPVPAFRLIGPERRAASREGTGLVGRAAELEVLYRAMREASAGEGRVVHVHAEAGVGKTRLVNEALATLTSAVRLRARCLAHESGAPYALFADLVRRSFGIGRSGDEIATRAALEAAILPLGLPAEAGTVPVVLELLGLGERSPLDPERKRHVLLGLLRQLARSRAQTAPLMLVVEDVHWIDAASASLLADAAGELARLRCLIVTTSRAATPLLPGATLLTLEPLGSADAAELVDRAAGRSLDAATRALVLERTGGNPFFIEQVVHALGSRQAATVPATIQDLLEARLDALEPGARLVGQRAAVIGRTFATRVLVRVADDASVPPALAALEREGFVRELPHEEAGRYAFRHALLQEVAYHALLIAQRRRIHAKVGAALEELYPGRLDEHLDQLAYHFARSDDHQKSRMYLMQAGRRAQHLYASDEALSYFRAAIEHSADDPAVRVAALEGVGDVQRVAGAYAEATTSYEQAIGDLPQEDIVGGARLRRKIGAVRQLQGAIGAALEAFAQALDELPREAERERAAVLVEIGLVRWQQGRFEDAVRSLTEAIARAEEAAADDVRADAHRQLGLVHNWRGDGEGALRYAREALALYERAGDVLGQANVLNNIGIAERKAGRYDAALAAQTKALEIRERVAEPWGIGLSSNNLAELHRRLGQLDLAEAGYRRALELFEAIGYSAGIGGACNGLAATMLEQGRPAEAHPYLERAQAELERMGNRTYLVHTERHWALAHLADDPAAALRWAERAVATAQALGAPDAEGISLQVLGLVRVARGETADALAALERGADLLRQTTERQELGRTLVTLGRLYARLPAEDLRRGSSPALLEEARTIFAALGAALDLRQLEAAAAVQERASLA